MSGSILSVRDVNKSFTSSGRPALKVLEGIGIEIKEGEFLSLVGPSGCGKTTLLRIMVGLERSDTGGVTLRGIGVSGVPNDIGFVFQEPALLPWRTVYQNIDIALASKDWSSSKRREAVNRYIEMVGLEAFASYPPYQVSGGMQRRVALARALVGAPDIIFMDEPFVALDAITRYRLEADLARIVAETGTTAVLITHDVEEALFLSDRIVVMRTQPGRIEEVLSVGQARPREMKTFFADPEIGVLRSRILELIEEFEVVLS